MRDISFKVTYIYLGSNKREMSIEYSILASSSYYAEAIANELFNVEIGNQIIKSVQVREELPSRDEVADVHAKLYDILSSLKRAFKNMSYKEFLRSYTVYRGYNFSKCLDSCSYTADFRGFTFKVEFSNGSCRLNDDEIVYYNQSRNRYYLIKGNEVFIAS